MRLLGLAFIPVLTVLVACMGHDNMMASKHLELFEEHSDAYRSEQDEHAQLVAAAPDTATISALEQEHLVQVSSHMDGMRHETADMMSCMGSDGFFTRAEVVNDDLARMEAECTRHDAAMKNAADVETARTEEDAHQAAMGVMMDEMQSHAATIMNGMMSMGCADHAD